MVFIVPLEMKPVSLGGNQFDWTSEVATDCRVQVAPPSGVRGSAAGPQGHEVVVGSLPTNPPLGDTQDAVIISNGINVDDD